MYSYSTLHLRILDVMVLENIYPVLSSDTKYEMVGKNTSVQLMDYDVTMYRP
jgi:hypothetical protein